MSAPRPLEPSRSVFHLTIPVGPRSNQARLNALHAARMQNTGPYLVVRIKFVFSADREIVYFGFRDYCAVVLDRGNKLNSFKHHFIMYEKLYDVTLVGIYN